MEIDIVRNEFPSPYGRGRATGDVRSGKAREDLPNVTVRNCATDAMARAKIRGQPTILLHCNGLACTSHGVILTDDRLQLKKVLC